MVSEQTFIDRIKKEFPDAIENQTKSYISFQVKNRKGKLQNFIEINFQNKGIKIAILSKSLRDSDFLIFNKKPDSFGWTLDAEYFIEDENSLDEILPFINKSYEFVKTETNSECYKVFREFLSKFVNQSNIYNSKDIEIKRSQKLDGAEHIYPALTIEGILYKVEMLNTGHFGPKSGNGYIKSPYFGYRLSDIDNSWINIRCGFQRFKLTEFKIVKWYSNNQDEDLGYKYLVKDLELESTAEPNDILKEFYDNFTSFYVKKEKKWYCAAFINREQAWIQYRPAVEGAKSDFYAMKKNAEREADPFSKAAACGAALRSGKKFLEKLEYARILNAQKEAEYAPDRESVHEVPSRIAAEKAKCSLYLNVKGDYGNIISSALTNTFSESGLSAAKSAGAANYNADVVVETNALGEDPISVYPSLEIKITSRDGKMVYSHQTKVSAKTVAYTLENAQKKSYPLLAERASKAVSQELSELFGN